MGFFDQILKLLGLKKEAGESAGGAGETTNAGTQASEGMEEENKTDDSVDTQ